MNQLAIRDAVLASGRADALNPELAILALFDAAIAKGVTVGAIGGFLRGLVELTFGEKEPLGAFEILLAPGSALSATFYAGH
jgi:thiamine transporter ThiT